jgi:hypothetical protein
MNQEAEPKQIEIGSKYDGSRDYMPVRSTRR